MAINKVVYGNQTLMDLTSDTVTEQDVAQGVTFHDASGVMRTGSASGGSGHIIEDRDGNALTQRATMKFVDGLKATDDSTNGKTIVSDNPDEYTWKRWNQLSKQERNAIPNALITNVPDVDGGIQADLMTKLWENPSPTSSFAPQTVTLASSDYDFLLVISKYNTSIDQTIPANIVPKGSGCLINYSSNTVIRIRAVVYTDDTHLAIDDAYTGNNKDNAVCIPVVIYGIKKTINLEFLAIASDVSTSADKCMLEDGVTSVQDAIDEEHFNVQGASVSLVDYSTDTNPYTFPNDGYVSVYATSAGAYARLRLMDANGTKMAIVKSIYNNADARNSIFVRKGMKAYVDQAVGSTGAYAVSYFPLISYAE